MLLDEKPWFFITDHKKWDHTGVMHVVCFRGFGLLNYQPVTEAWLDGRLVVQLDKPFTGRIEGFGG